MMDGMEGRYAHRTGECRRIASANDGTSGAKKAIKIHFVLFCTFVLGTPDMHFSYYSFPGQCVCVCFYLMRSVAAYVCVHERWLVLPYVRLYVERSIWHLSFISAGVLDTNVSNVFCVVVGLDGLHCIQS